MNDSYRYVLRRETPTVFSPAGALCWVMLNPSTADDRYDDPTIRRCIGFTRSNLYARLEVVNLFAARATNPRDLHAFTAPVGPGNDLAIEAAFSRADAVVFAWGAHRHPLIDDRIATVVRSAAVCGLTPLCLGATKDGSPRHPLYVRADQPLEVWQHSSAATQPA